MSGRSAELPCPSLCDLPISRWLESNSECNKMTPGERPHHLQCDTGAVWHCSASSIFCSFANARASGVVSIDTRESLGARDAALATVVGAYDIALSMSPAVITERADLSIICALTCLGNSSRIAADASGTLLTHRLLDVVICEGRRQACKFLLPGYLTNVGSVPR